MEPSGPTALLVLRLENASANCLCCCDCCCSLQLKPFFLPTVTGCAVDDAVGYRCYPYIGATAGRGGLRLRYWRVSYANVIYSAKNTASCKKSALLWLHNFQGGEHQLAAVNETPHSPPANTCRESSLPRPPRGQPLFFFYESTRPRHTRSALCFCFVFFSKTTAGPHVDCRCRRPPRSSGVDTHARTSWSSLVVVSRVCRLLLTPFLLRSL